MARVLVVDDEPALRDTMRRMLERAGHEVIVAADGTAALDLMKTQTVDLIITDIFMPGQDGLELLRRLRSAGKNPKVIAVSGGDRTGTMDLQEHAQGLGARRTLSKPFELRTLLDTVAEVLREP